MGVSMNTNVSAYQGASDIISVTMMKKAMAIDAQTVMTLINAIPQPPQNPANLPPNLGQNINVTA